MSVRFTLDHESSAVRLQYVFAGNGKRYILWSGEEGSTNRCLQTEPAIAVSDNTIREMVRAYSHLVKFISWRHPPVRDLPRYLNHY